MTAEEPLVVTFDVRSDADRAFQLWTMRTSLWWPKAHTISGDPASIVFEPYPGGRIFERGKDGAEHIWGEITHWDEPREVAFRWHLFFAPEQATHVAITFEADGEITHVRLSQTGFAKLGEAGQLRREATTNGWAATFAAFTAAAEAG